MPNQVQVDTENNFTRGLITEATGLNFPDNAATETDNCEYTLIGAVNRRLGIDYETNYALGFADRVNSAVSSFKWNNAGGDGDTQVVVTQVGTTLYFYLASSATDATPLSAHQLPTTVDISAYAVGNDISSIGSKECQYSEGNGYLFVFHPDCNSFYCTYSSGVISSTAVSLKVRDFVGAKETPTIALDFRPTELSVTHHYNLLNQGWTDGSGSHSGLTVGSGSPAVAIGLITVPLTSASAGFTVGNVVTFTTVNNLYPGGKFVPAGTSCMTGIVTAYVGVNLTVNVTSIYTDLSGFLLAPYTIYTSGQGYIDTWHAAFANYPSNSDVWWYYKNTSDIFAPATTIASVSLSSGRAPFGHYILDAFNQRRTNVSGVTGLTDVITTSRPRTGCWWQGRVWYAGVDGNQVAGGTSDNYTWTENIYFSQVISTPDDFGSCYQINDPTSDKLNGQLPTDGGIILEPGMGSVYKLWPTNNGLLIFAANGVWFVTGSRGIGFSANDYTLTKLSSVPCISGTSFVDVLGLPFFWNEDGIYQVQSDQQGQLGVNPITVGTIQTFYDDIPKSSKQYVRGAYNPVEYQIQWLYKDVEATSTDDRYSYNRILNYNTYNKAFFPYSVDNTVVSIMSLLYVVGPGGLNTPASGFKYFVSQGNNTTFADFHSTTYKDWSTYSAKDYIAYFITGFRLKGAALRNFQQTYIDLYFKTNGAASGCYLQGIWDWSNSPNSGRWSTQQKLTNALTRFDVLRRRCKLRGRGMSLQFKISSLDTLPFSIQGWATMDTVNAGV